MKFLDYQNLNKYCWCLVAQLCPLYATPWTVAHQAPLSMGFPRKEYWSGLRFPTPGDLPNLGIEPVSPALQADSLPLSHQGSPAQDIILRDKKQDIETICILIHSKNV